MILRKPLLFARIDAWLLIVNHITIAYPITSSLFYNSNFFNTSVMIDINQHGLNSEYYTIYNISFSNFISFVFYIYLDVYFICIWISIHVIYYIDNSSSFILSSHSDSFYRYDMYLYIRTCSHNIKYLVNYQYLKLNTEHGTVGTQFFIHKFNIFLNLDFTNPYLQIQTIYIRISPMYDYYFKNVLYNIIIYILIDPLINSLNISIIQCIRVV